MEDNAQEVRLDASILHIGAPPMMLRQVTVEMPDDVDVEDVRKNGLYQYLMTHQLSDAVNNRSLLRAQLDYLDAMGCRK
jgi:hypothetical protein